MKVSEITTKELLNQIRVMEDELDPGEIIYIEALKKAAVEYVKSYTGLTEEDMDCHEDITIAVLVLFSDMYDNRQMYVVKNQVNRVVDTILGMYSINLLPSER